MAERGWLAASALLLTLGACAERSDSRADAARDLLPARVHGMPRVESTSGEAAAEMIGRLHTSSVAPLESQIGLYSDGGLRAVVFISRFDSPAAADSQLALMARRIGEGAAGYGHFSSFVAGSATVYQAFGMGQVHYFFCDADRVTWLAASPEIARPILAELLAFDIDEIPPLFEHPTVPPRTELPQTFPSP